ISFLLVAFLFYQFIDIFAMLAVSILIAMIFSPVVEFLEERGLNRLLSVIIVFVLVGFLTFSGLSYLLPKILGQLDALTNTLTQENLQNLLRQFEKSVKSIFPIFSSVDFVQRFSNLFQNIILDWVNNLTNIFYRIISIVAILVIVPFMTFFLLKDNKRIICGLINIMPNKYFEVSYAVLRKIGIQLGRFVRGWIFDAFLVGLLSGIGLTALGINNAASIGFVAGVGHLIPYFGPIIGGIPAIIISLIQFGNFSMLPSIVLMFLGVYTIDNGLIQPNVFSKSTDMHPLIIIILILAGSQTAGVLGMLLAVPIATVIRTAAKEIYLGYKNYKIIKI
ncbi:MAG: AI-2E family transporter, partial [Bacteroidetes bacterium]|nr:AI-2E family transporter [Bacteroidota bacterium]